MDTVKNTHSLMLNLSLISLKNWFEH